MAETCWRCGTWPIGEPRLRPGMQVPLCRKHMQSITSLELQPKPWRRLTDDEYMAQYFPRSGYVVSRPWLRQ